MKTTKHPTPLSSSETKVLMSEIRSLWQELGPDLEASFADEDGEVLTNECVVEALLDAQRLEVGLRECKQTPQVELTKLALKKFRALPFDTQCDIINEQLGPFV